MTTWSYGGVALSTYGKVTMIDDDLDIAERRGENIVIPFKHGSTFVPKYYAERKITFGIAIKTATAGALETLIDSLKANIGSRVQKTLSQTREDASVRTALASVDNSIQIKRETGVFARIVIEFVLPFPFFRLSTDIADNTTVINSNPKTMNVTNPGSAEEVEPTIILTGPLSNTVITNPANGSVLSYAGAIASPRIVTLSVVNNQWVATDDLGANKINLFSHSGGQGYFSLETGLNPLSIADDTATTGTVKIIFKAPFH